MSEDVLSSTGLGKKYRRAWALRNCNLTLPRGKLAALVGPNGAGKTTLLKLAAGLLMPTEGRIEVLGETPGWRGSPAGLSFLGQDKPLYRSFRVEEMLRAGNVLNPGGWDGATVKRMILDAGVPLQAKVGTLSGGQRARVAVALALGRRPELLLLDEPLADLDPLARRQVMAALLAEVADTGTTVLLSSHVIADLEDVCDHLILLRDGRAWLAGDVEDLVAGHRVITGPAGPLPSGTLVHRSGTGRQTTALVRGTSGPAGFRVEEPGLEELVLGYLQADQESATPEPVGATS